MLKVKIHDTKSREISKVAFFEDPMKPIDPEDWPEPPDPLIAQYPEVETAW